VILLDTHVMLWRAMDDRRLGRRAARRIDAALRSGVLCVSAFSFWEVALLVGAGRVRMRATVDEFRAASLGAGIVEVAVDGKIAIASTQLAMHADPADRIIVATALDRHATLVTADAKILAMGAGPACLDAQL